DSRIVAIAPMVIPTLNMRAQTKHQIEVWGKYSEQIDDYTRRGLVEITDTPDGERLWKMIDPYTYRDRITIPKLIINSTNDRYWTLDSLNVFWDDLTGPKNVVYLPNAGHNMNEHRQWAVNGVGALVRHVASNQEMPKVWWKHTDGNDGSLVLSLNAEPAPKSVKLWSTHAETRDFREAKWTSSLMDKDKNYVGSIPRPKDGHAALFGDLTFEFDGLEYHLSTLIRESNPEPSK
ncbi:MAG: PhoPQ-activated protein PqaA family protein, partial [Isosphaeraceae bacterium]